ncbi:hypothetical protein BN1423_1130027 [Carnobacterium maltaromaticum]|nr:hypothetical protein BN1423_1130027 [Carnobacterium maltaromaticum]
MYSLVYLDTFVSKMPAFLAYESEETKMMMNRKTQIKTEKKSKDNELKKLGYLQEEEVLSQFDTSLAGLTEDEAKKPVRKIRSQ